MLCMILVSCTGQKTGKENDNNDKIAIEVGEIKFPPQDVLQLKSYYLSSSVHVDSIDYLIGYNSSVDSSPSISPSVPTLLASFSVSAKP